MPLMAFQCVLVGVMQVGSGSGEEGVGCVQGPGETPKSKTPKP